MRHEDVMGAELLPPSDRWELRNDWPVHCDQMASASLLKEYNTRYTCVVCGKSDNHWSIFPVEQQIADLTQLHIDTGMSLQGLLSEVDLDHFMNNAD